MVANLAISRFRGAPVGNDPWCGDTLEWSTTSPPPPYNYAVIPRVTSPYAMWDREDREKDADRLARGVDLLDEGHETSATSVLDADWDEILNMPSDSPWPIVLAVALSGVFVMLLIQHYMIAALFGGLVALALVAWHHGEPQEA